MITCSKCKRGYSVSDLEGINFILIIMHEHLFIFKKE